MLEYFYQINPITIGIFVFVMTHILFQYDCILHLYWKILDSLNSKGYWYIAKPLGYCDVCFAGEIALWTGFYKFGFDFYTIFCNIILTIFVTHFLKSLFND